MCVVGGAGGRWMWYCLLPVNEGNHNPMFRYLMHCNSGESSKGVNLIVFVRHTIEAPGM